MSKIRPFYTFALMLVKVMKNNYPVYLCFTLDIYQCIEFIHNYTPTKLFQMWIINRYTTKQAKMSVLNPYEGTYNTQPEHIKY